MTSAGEAILVVEGGASDGETIPLTLPNVTMGRELDSVVVVSEHGVSRRHAAIVKDDAGHHLRDLSSTNGTFVNGQKMGDKSHLLKDSDTIRLGASKASFVYHSPTAETLILTLETTVGVVETPTQAVTKAEPPSEPEHAVTPSDVSLSVDNDETYEGTVRLNVKSEGSLGSVIRFVQRLGENEDCKILRLAGDARKSGVEAWLFLRRPLSLRDWLGDMEGVARVSETEGRDLRPGSSDTPLTVMLDATQFSSTVESSLCVNCNEILEPGTTVCTHCGKTQT
jgi:pSer/pThr/pTyr-binding forkhead associated (FHA) protein